MSPRWRAITTAPLIAAVRFYQLIISAHLGQTCLFYPSCSAYMIEALQVHGPVRGLWLGSRRLLRCHPWSYGGVDHVPAASAAANSTTNGEPASPRD